MRKILMYVQNNIILFMLLLLSLTGVVILWNLYLSEKRKAAREKDSVADERKFYQIFAQAKTDAFIVAEKKNLFLQYISPNFEVLTGIPTEYFQEDIMIVKKLLSHSSFRKIREQLKNWNKEELLSIEMEYHKDGDDKERFGRIQISETKDKKSFLVILSDITEEYKVRREMEQELETAYRESQSKTDFLSKMSHEIRTPMNGIIGMLNLIRAHMDDRIQTEAYLNKTEELSQFLLTLINDILDMSRIESGKMKLEETPFDLYALADKLDAMFRSTAEDKGIHWEVKMQDVDVHRVIGDEMRLSQVIINFISNANKFTPAGGTVSVMIRQMNKLDGMVHLMIRVRDTGKGIKEDFISKIFRPFEQEDASTAHNYGGSGLGMAIADSMIKLMNGEILVESEEGKGTEFTVYLALPVAEEESGEQRVENPRAVVDEEEMKKAAEEFTMQGLHILLAEDNDINAEIAMEILAMQGAVLERACNGKEAVEKFARSEDGTYDVILMDIQMPEMDGWEATRNIRQMHRRDADLPIFAMSANAFVEDRRRSIEAGMNGHINKPVNYDELRREIGEHMYKVRSH